MSDAEKAAELVRRLRELSAQKVDPAGAEDPRQAVEASKAKVVGVLMELKALGPAAAGPLIELLENGRGVELYHAANSLGQRRDARAVEPLLEKLNAPSDIGAFAIYAVNLGLIGDARAVAPLIDALERAEERAAQDAAHMRDAYAATVDKSLLGKLGRLFASAQFRRHDAFLVRTGRAAICHSAAVALGMLGDARAVGPLKRRLGDPDPKVRETVEQALAKLNAA